MRGLALSFRMTTKMQQDATLLDVLIDGFETNESGMAFTFGSFHIDEAAVIRKFATFADEVTRWKGEPLRKAEAGNRRLAAWYDLELRQVDRAIMVLVKTPGFDSAGGGRGPGLPRRRSQVALARFLRTD